MKALSYAQQQAEQFTRLTGKVIDRWHGVEMAIRDCGRDGGPEFAEAGCEWFQFLVLIACVEGREEVVGTCQNDDTWGLCLLPSGSSDSAGEDYSGIFRERMVSELPVCLVESVSPTFDAHGELEKIVLVVGDDRVEMVAGEYYEQLDGSLRIQLSGDESVLVRVGA
jgi:hypothetical protein